MAGGGGHVWSGDEILADDKWLAVENTTANNQPFEKPFKMGGKSSLLEQKFNKKFKNVTVKQDEEGLCVIPDRPPSFSQKLHCQKCPKKLNLSRSITLNNIWQPIC